MDRKSSDRQYPYIIEVLCDRPENTVVDGEVVALDNSDRLIPTGFNRSVKIERVHNCFQKFKKLVIRESL
jgi:hypothetical protein